ncbi:SHOCT domain-containing protein [Aeromonas sp. MdU4]|uniref:SHOCT domain-containing protein n=1 Tax=Aeromonas sp. MdU4 TaxID=3342819 RepID=UPI0035BA3DD4
MKYRAVSIVLLALLITACTSSGVIPIGPDTYTIGTTSELSPALAKKQAMEEAVAYCRSHGKEIMPMQIQRGSHQDSFGDSLATFDYTFRCLDRSDASLGRPELKDPTIDVRLDQNIKNTGSVESKSDLYTELKKLDQLKRDGILTENEFQEQKKKLLERH